MNYTPLADKIRQLTEPTAEGGAMPPRLQRAWAELERTYRQQYESEYGTLAQRHPFFHELSEKEQASMIQGDIGVAVQAVSPWRRQMLADGEHIIGQSFEKSAFRSDNGRSR